VHDFEDRKLGKVVPYGVYDVTANCLDIVGDPFHPEWNYTISPRPP
jgi:hypothetical protein